MNYSLGRFGILLILTAMLSGCFQLFETGENTVSRIIYNPSKNKQVILFTKDGDATVPNSIQVSILDGNEKLDKSEGGNTFTLKHDALLDSNAINFKWLDDVHLLITYNKKLQTYIQNNKVNNVLIEYKAQ